MLLNYLPRDAALWREIHGDDVFWGLNEQLQAAMVDAAHVANWQRSAKKGSKPPKRIPRPGVKDAHVTKFGGDVVVSPEQVKTLLAEIDAALEAAAMENPE